MPRRSSRLMMSKDEMDLTQQMGASKEPEESSLSEDEHEKTILKHDAVADLREEIKILKLSMDALIKKSSAPMQTKNDTSQLPPTSPSVPQTTTISSSSLLNQKLSIPGNYNLQYNYVAQPSPIQATQASQYQPLFEPPNSLSYFLQQPTMPYSVSVTNQPRASTSHQLPPMNQSMNTPRNQFEPQPQAFQPVRKLYDLPEFSGQPEQWPMFSVSFRETTRHYNYTHLENLFRLQKSLKGNAKAKVEAYLIHPESVDQVMSTLEFHYGRPHIMVRSQIAKARAFPAISARNISEIVNFSTMVSNLTVFLENAGAKPHLDNPTLLEELINKLPLSKREEWVKHSLINLGQYPSVRQFSEWLQNVATYISIATETESQENSITVREKNRLKPSFSITLDDRNGTKCIMCHSSHYLTQCTRFRNCSTAQRWKFVKDKRLCFCCLKAGHNCFQCSNRRLCGISGCNKGHNRLLHENGKNETMKDNNNRDGQMKTAAGGEGTLNSNEYNGGDNYSVTTIIENQINKGTLFKYLPVTLKGPKGAINITAFIDEGSKVSLLEEEVANEIGLKGPKSNLSLGWIGGRKSSTPSMKIDLEICGLNAPECCFQMKNLRTANHLALPTQSLNIRAFKEKFHKLKDVDIEGYRGATPKLLIGLPHIRLIRPQQILDLDDSFSVHKTALGNLIFGSNEDHCDPYVFVIEPDNIDDLKQQVSDYFTLEGFGMKPMNPIVSNDDLRAEKILEDTTVKIGQQYETGLLWKSENCTFRETFSMAYKRLHISEQKMKKDSDLQEWYRNKVEEYISKGYAKKLPKEEASVENERTWYLPHFVIKNINKNNKRRLVFDAAATVEGESFNSRLLKGPAKYQPKPLLGILFKFRQRQIGVCGDIREMFHRIMIRKEDQTAQRFLWRTNITDSEPDIYVMQAMIFGSASSPCSAQYVKNLNAKDFEESDERAYRAIVECHYVDDFVDSFDTPDEAISVAKSVVAIHKRAGFELRDLVSNSIEFCNAFRTSCNSNKESRNLSICETTAEKVLGLYWMPDDDTFNFVLKFSKVPEAVLNGQRRPTKRELLSLVMSIFDPFGFLASFVIRAKLLLQELWSYNIGWSSPLPDEIHKKWLEWYNEAQNARKIKFNRCYHKCFTEKSALIDLHIFVDASEVAFAAVAFWRVKTRTGVELVFVAGKCKCAPLRPLSIPRLELLAAVIGVRLKDAIVASHDVQPEQITFWSDSKTVVKWIQSDCRIYKQFVSHRIAEILENSQVNQWRWVPGSLNPADDATRPHFFSGNKQGSRWLNGPDFLKLEESEWPKLGSETGTPLCETEIRAKFVLSVIQESSLIPLNDISSYYKLLRIKCWIDRAVHVFKCSVEHQNKSSLNFKPYLTAKEINGAETYWCQQAQREEFRQEYELLKSGQPIPKGSSIYTLSPYLANDGLIRISGRLNNAASIERNTREPIIMPKDNLITKLIVKHYHEIYAHQNQESICAAIRTKFWIPSIRQLVRRAKRLCQLCKNRDAAPETPLMGQLPEDRVTPFVRPFTYTGVDYFGPYTVAIGRRCEKRWVSLFTCMTTRAVHLELARDLSADAVILCLRNFMNRRGLPTRIRSDRGTNFVGASKERLVEFETAVGDECSKRGIEWIFNTPANPSAGGAWERLVRAIKNVLSFTLKDKSPPVDTLNSLLIEAENLVNSRPLTHLPIESLDSEPITPNHFLIGGPNIVRTPAVEDRICLRKQWHILQQLKQTFWRRWVLEYLPDLTRRTKWFQPAKPLRIGDVVIICDENEERGKWKRGVVEEIFKAADGQVRSAVIRTTVGSLRRPASKLAVLDLVSEPPK